MNLPRRLSAASMKDTSLVTKKSSRHKQGFTLDAEICPAIGEARWMRLIAAPVCAEGKAVRLHGIKLII